MSLISGVSRLINYTTRAAKVSPYIIFGNGAHTLVNAMKNAPVKDALKIGGKAVEAEVQATKALHGGLFKHAWTALKTTPSVIAKSTKAGYRAASIAGKGFFGKLAGSAKGLFRGIGKKMPLIGNLMLIGFELPNIITATKEQGIGTGVTETLKAGARLGGASIGAAIGTAVCPVVGSLIGWVAGEWLTSKIVGKSYTEKKAEEEAKLQEELAFLQQEQGNAQVPFTGNTTQLNTEAINNVPLTNPNNPYGMSSNPFSMMETPYNMMSNPYANDIMMQNLQLDMMV
ncbi:MAG: hypothetical protein ACI37Q_02325 [Candidatus Gastranaerophilaceae bacterium]